MALSSVAPLAAERERARKGRGPSEARCATRDPTRQAAGVLPVTSRRRSTQVRTKRRVTHPDRRGVGSRGGEVAVGRRSRRPKGEELEAERSRGFGRGYSGDKTLSENCQIEQDVSAGKLNKR